MACTMTRVESRLKTARECPVIQEYSLGVYAGGLAESALQIFGGNGLNDVVDGQFDDNWGSSGLVCCRYERLRVKAHSRHSAEREDDYGERMQSSLHGRL